MREEHNLLVSNVNYLKQDNLFFSVEAQSM